MCILRDFEGCDTSDAATLEKFKADVVVVHLDWTNKDKKRERQRKAGPITRAKALEP